MLKENLLGAFIAANYALTAVISGGFILPIGYLFLIGDFVYCYLNPSRKIKFVAFRKYFDIVANLWFSLTVWLMEVASGIKMVFSGDLKGESNKSSALIIVNHRTRLDWLFMWCFLFRFGNLSHEKIILKDSLKRVPGFGWAMQAFGFIFLKRKWEEDSLHVENSLKYYAKQEYPIQLLLFPEGTDFNESTKKVSQNFSKKIGNMDPFQFVLFPRFKAWQSSVEILTSNETVDYIFDVTIGYPDLIPQNEKYLFTGKHPKEIHFHIKKYNIKDVIASKNKQGIQIGDEKLDGISQWCLERWQEKEERLKNFYEKKTFSSETNINSNNIGDRNITHLIYLFWVATIVGSFYLLFTSNIGRAFFVLGIIWHISMTKLVGGADMLQLKLYKYLEERRRTQ